MKFETNLVGRNVRVIPKPGSPYAGEIVAVILNHGNFQWRLEILLRDLSNNQLRRIEDGSFDLEFL